MIYSKKVLDIFKNPKNLGKMKNPDAVGEVGNPTCGDVMRVYIKVKEEKDKKIISEISCETFGCVAAIATSSMTTQMAIGMTLEEAKQLGRGEVAEALDGLPPQKMHCSNLAADALHKAIEDYESKQNA